MMTFFSKHRFHESIALATVFAASVTLHVAWISNLLVAQVPLFQQWASVVPSIGPISGLYLKAVLVFIIVSILSVLYLRGKDCSMHRKSILFFFIASIVVFLVMTIPFVYSFSAVIGA